MGGGSSIQCTDFRGGGGHDTVLRMGGGGHITVHSYRGGGGTVQCSRICLFSRTFCRDFFAKNIILL